MTSPLLIEFPGAIDHFTNRWVGRWEGRQERLFRDVRDFDRFVQGLEKGIQDDRIRRYLFRPMSNPFHLALETPQGNRSRFMQRLVTGCSVCFKVESAD